MPVPPPPSAGGQGQSLVVMRHIEALQTGCLIPAVVPRTTPYGYPQLSARYEIRSSCGTNQRRLSTQL